MGMMVRFHRGSAVPLVLVALLAVLIVLSLGIGGCKPPAAESPSQDGTATASPGASGSGTGGTSVPLSTFKEPAHGFSFSYPTSWAVTTQSNLVQVDQMQLALIIQYRRAGEQVQFEGGAGAGDFVEEGKVTCLGQDIPRKVLVFRGKDKAVYYNGTSLIQAGNLEFVIALSDFSQDYAAVDIPAAIQAEVDAIVASLRVQ